MDKGFWATLVGGFIGGAIGLYIGGLAGFTVLPGLGIGSDENFGDFYTVFAAAGVGAWLGCLAGAYGLLRLARADRVRVTVGALAFVAPTLVGGATWLAVSWTDADDFGSNFIPYVIFVVAAIGTAYLSRSLATGSSEGSETA